MLTRAHRLTLLSFLLVGSFSAIARAADHGDGTSSGIALALDPAADINDVFSWMSADAAQVNLAMTVFPGATATSKFSDAVKYVFHTASLSAYLGAEVKRDIVCTFTNSSPQVASCWLVDPADGSVKEYLSGNAGAAAGVASTDGKMKAFAGLRSDPFFFNLAGFRNATSIVAAALKEAGPTLNGTYIKGVDTMRPGCPLLTAAGRNAVVGVLNKDCTGAGAAIDFFKKPAATDNTACTTKPALVSTQTVNAGLTGNVMGIVLTIDKTLLTAGGPVVNVWAATTK
jgi:hypothetical protein